ncbi:hypothetical protein F5Y14DRAFT_413859 [Nemania sp. NC0429]|nr:hypothetical protein F5Y14DRAFT_413859 [Nemania sp. NC0429]
MDEVSRYQRSLGALTILPPELRNLVYKFALVGPPTWHHPYNAECCLPKPENGRPARACQLFSHKYSVCRGRPGTGLLQVSRAINREASPIFWSQNVFCFVSGDDFVDCVGARLRSEYRSLLRHIYILGTFHNLWAFHRSLDVESKPFETTIRQCTGLRTIGIDVGKPDDPCPRDHLETRYVKMLADMVPPKVQFNFLQLSLTTDLSYAEPRIPNVYYRCLYQKPYSVHDEPAAGKRTSTLAPLLMQHCRVVYEPSLPGPFLIVYLRLPVI